MEDNGKVRLEIAELRVEMIDRYANLLKWLFVPALMAQIALIAALMALSR